MKLAEYVKAGGMKNPFLFDNSQKPGLTSTNSSAQSGEQSDAAEVGSQLTSKLAQMNDEGNTLLMLASYAGHAELTKALLDLGERI